MPHQRAIHFFTQNYPSPRFPERGAFVERLVRQWEEIGYDITVIAPETWANKIRLLHRPVRSVSIAGKEIVRSRYVSVGVGSGGLIHPYRITRKNFVRAAIRSSLGLPTADYYYGKFLFRGGEAAVRLGQRVGRPAFADLGESWSLLSLDPRSKADARSILHDLAGVVCVSPRLRAEVLALGADPDRVFLAPNDVDRTRFVRMDRQRVRQQLGISPDHFVVAFTGHFVERKGPLRVLAAIERLDKRIVGVFLGRGEQIPQGERVLFAGSVPNDTVPLWLNAADLFVLPTRREGNCNAIIEALAVGLPVVSSDIPDIHGQVEPSFGTLVDPDDVEAIGKAIDLMYRDSELRARMGDAALASIHGSDAEGRAVRILRFMRKFSAADQNCV